MFGSFMEFYDTRQGTKLILLSNSLHNYLRSLLYDMLYKISTLNKLTYKKPY